MSSYAEAIRSAYARGYRVDDEGVMVSPRGTRMRPQINPKRPYPRVTYRMPDGRRLKIELHKFVAYQKYGEEALQPGIYARHLDGNPPNVRPNNIAIGSPSDNAWDKGAETLRRVALIAAKSKRKLSDEQTLELVALRAQGWSGKALAAHFDIRKSTVSEILSGKLYSEVTGIQQRPRTRRDVPAHLEESTP